MAETEKPKRKSLSKKLRFEVFKRDGFKCQYCGAHPPSVLLHVDHIIAVAAGGLNAIDNLVAACESCNLGKGARSLGVVPKSLAEKAAEVEEREAQILGYQAILDGKRQRLESETWRVLEVMFGRRDTAPRDEFNSTHRFIEKLGVHAALEAAEIALGSPASYRNTFRYFCGICWNKVREGEANA